MRELYEKCVKEIKNAGVVQVGDERPERRKLPASVLKQRAAYKAMGIVVGSDVEVDLFAAGLHVAASCALTTTLTSQKAAKTEATELERWNRLPPTEDVDNPLRFLHSRGKEPMFKLPMLFKLALDIFSISAMSSECERVFSETKQLITDERKQLAATTIEAIQCQKNWLDNGLVYSELTEVVALAKRT